MSENKFFNYQNLIKILLSALFVAPLILWSHYIFPFIVPKVIVLRSLVLCLLGAYIILLFSDFQRFRPRLNFLTISVLLFWLSFGISTFAGVDWYHSFWDNHERMLGLFTITHYVLIYLIGSSVITSDRDWMFIFRSVLILGSVVMLIGFWQKFVDPEALLNRGSNRVSATLGNAIYYSGYGLFLTFLGVIQYYRERQISRLWSYISLFVGFFGFIGIFLGGTRGSLLGLIVGVAVLVLCYGFLSKEKTQLTRLARYAAVLGVAVFALLFAFRTTPFVSQIPLLGRLINSSFSAGTATTRIMSWKIAVESWKEKPVFGWGPNNYFYAFNAHYDPRFLEHGWSETWFDNAHSVFFNTLTVQGIVGLSLYLLIYGSAITLLYLGIRRSQINQHLGFFSIAFLIAHFFGLITVFENPTSYLYFFVFLAFVFFLTSSVKIRAVNTVNNLETSQKNSVSSRPSARISVGVSIAVWVFVVCLFYITNIGPARANKATARAMQKVYAGVADATLFDDPLSFSSPHIDDIRNDISRIVFENIPQMVQQGKTLQVSGLFDRAITELRKNQALHPRDVRVHFTLSQFYNLGYQLTQNKEMMVQSEVELRRSLDLSPKRQQFEYALAYNLVDQKRTTEAEQVLKQSIENNPKISEGWWRLAVLYSYEVSSSTARALIDEALEKGITFDANGKSILSKIGINVP